MISLLFTLSSLLIITFTSNWTQTSSSCLALVKEQPRLTDMYMVNQKAEPNAKPKLKGSEKCSLMYFTCSHVPTFYPYSTWCASSSHRTWCYSLSNGTFLCSISENCVLFSAGTSTDQRQCSIDEGASSRLYTCPIESESESESENESLSPISIDLDTFDCPVDLPNSMVDTIDQIDFSINFDQYRQLNLQQNLTLIKFISSPTQLDHNNINNNNNDNNDIISLPTDTHVSKYYHSIQHHFSFILIIISMICGIYMFETYCCGCDRNEYGTAAVDH